MSKYIINFTRRCGKRINEKVLSAQIDYIVRRGMSGGRGSGWVHKVLKDGEPDYDPITNSWVTNKTVVLQKERGRIDNADHQFRAMIEVMEVTLPQAKAGGPKWPWTLTVAEELKEKINIAIDKGPQPPQNKPVRYANVNLEKGEYFSEIFERDAQVNIILSAIDEAVYSNMENRFHCILHGPPACGKSTTVTAACNMLGEEGIAYFKFDATSITEAGIRQYLKDADERGEMPPVIVLEEIEKTEDKMLRWLLGVLDFRAEIRITNARVGNVRISTPMLCLATANNFTLFETVMSGALASRFSHPIYFPPPDRTMLFKILQRDVRKRKGDERWIEPALVFCCDQHNMTDPRKILSICLCGKDKLLSGEYQDYLRRSRKEFYEKT